MLSWPVQLAAKLSPKHKRGSTNSQRHRSSASLTQLSATTCYPLDLLSQHCCNLEPATYASPNEAKRVNELLNHVFLFELSWNCIGMGPNLMMLPNPGQWLPIPGQWLPFPGPTPTISRSNPYHFPSKGFLPFSGNFRSCCFSQVDWHK